MKGAPDGRVFCFMWMFHFVAVSGQFSKTAFYERASEISFSGTAFQEP
jgi:hypothetical protein